MRNASPENPRERYGLVPQMETYDALPGTLRPYLMLGTPRNFTSPVVNTDDNGFRLSYRHDAVIDSSAWPSEGRRGLLVGGSVSFGVGSSGDRTTIASLLSEATGTAFLNLGIRGANSTQELISTIPFIREAHTIVVASGVNNAVTALQSIGRNDLFGPFFGEGSVEHLSRWPTADLVELTYQSGGTLAAKAARRLRLFRRAGASAGMVAASVAKGRRPVTRAKAIAAAAERHARDLGILAAAAQPGARVIFALQPLADACPRTPVDEERRLFELSDTRTGLRWHQIKDFLLETWPEYVDRLRVASTAAGVPFVDLNTLAFDGWSFVDRVHLTDHGYAQATDRILEALM